MLLSSARWAVPAACLFFLCFLISNANAGQRGQLLSPESSKKAVSRRSIEETSAHPVTGDSTTPPGHDETTPTTTDTAEPDQSNRASAGHQHFTYCSNEICLYGTCVFNDHCECDAGYTGRECEDALTVPGTTDTAATSHSQEDLSAPASPTGCNNNLCYYGICVFSDHCECQAGYTGTECNVHITPMAADDYSPDPVTSKPAVEDSTFEPSDGQSLSPEPSETATTMRTIQETSAQPVAGDSTTPPDYDETTPSPNDAAEPDQSNGASAEHQEFTYCNHEKCFFGTCVFNDHCECDAEYTGRECTEELTQEETTMTTLEPSFIAETDHPQGDSSAPVLPTVCNNNLCHNGICVFNHHCECNAGYTGTECNVHITPMAADDYTPEPVPSKPAAGDSTFEPSHDATSCQVNPCDHGTCLIAVDKAPRCVCSPGWTSGDCSQPLLDNRLTAAVTSTKLSSGAVFGVVLGVIVLVAIAVTLVVMRKKLSYRSSVARTDPGRTLVIGVPSEQDV